MWEPNEENAPKRPYKRGLIDVTFSKRLEGAIKKRLLSQIRDWGDKNLEDRHSLWEMYRQLREMRIRDLYYNQLHEKVKEEDSMD